jgi:hypothetical protein
MTLRNSRTFPVQGMSLHQDKPPRPRHDRNASQVRNACRGRKGERSWIPRRRFTTPGEDCARP